MADLNPELLMAYVDGELDDEQEAFVEALIASDPEAKAIIERYRETDDRLRSGFDEVIRMPVPQHLVDTLRKAKSDPTIVPLRSTGRTPSSVGWTGLALAASIALVVGVLSGGWIFGGLRLNSPPAIADFLHEALETQPAGTALMSGDGMETITPTLTFHAVDNRICREFERLAGTRRTVGVGCRDDDGKWIALAEIDFSLLGAENGTERSYAPASGPPDPLSAVLSIIGAGPSLNAAEENQLRNGGWH